MRECQASRAPGRVAGAAAAWRSAACRTGPCDRARFATKTYPGYECRGKLGDGRGRNRGHRQWTGAHRDVFPVERVADAPRRPSQQGFGEAKSRASGTHRTRPRAAPLHRGGLPAPARSTTRRRSCAVSYPSFASLCERCGLAPSTISTGWMRRPRQQSKGPSRCSIAWAPQKPWRSSWRGIRCIPGCRAFSLQLWSAAWARTAVLPRRCSGRVLASRKMTFLRLWIRIRITARGSRSSSSAELPGLPDSRITTTTLC